METEPKQELKQNNLLIPVAIVAAGALIAGAVYFGGGGTRQANAPRPQGAVAQADELEKMNPIGKDDHIRGNPDAPVKIVEYSDTECPFCKRFHPTMKQAMDEYGKDGKVAWVYRHFPLDALHPIKARKEAVATECADEIGGNESFWKYLDRFFELTPSNNQTDIDTVLPQIAGELGLDKNKFTECLSSGKYDAHVQADLDNATATGGTGTPWSIVVAQNGKKYPLSGAQPYSAVKQLIEMALSEK